MLTTTILTCALALTTGEKFQLGNELLSLKAPDLANQTRAELPAALSVAFERHGRYLDSHPLAVHTLAEAGVVLFTETDEKDARWITALVQQSSRVFAEKYGVEPTGPGEPLVVFHFLDANAYEGFLYDLAVEQPYLRDWIPFARELNAFSTYQPPMMVILEDEHSNRSTSRDNMIVHLTGHLDLYRHFGLQPFWLREAAGMDLEVTLLDKLYPSCASEHFVVKGGPGAWRSDVSRAWKRGTRETLGDIMEMEDGTYPKELALQALGLVRHLLANSPELLHEYLSTLAADRTRLGLENTVVEPAAQMGFLRRLLSKDDVERAVRELRKTEKRRRNSPEELWRKELKAARSAARSNRR